MGGYGDGAVAQRWQRHLLLLTGEVEGYEETLIHHAPTLFRRGAEDEPLDPIQELGLFRESKIRQLYAESRARGLARRLRSRPRPQGAESATKLGNRLEELTERYVAPAFEAAG